VVTNSLDALRETLRTEMPVTQHLGIEAAGYRGGVISLRAPLLANVNHKGTAFGGSLNAIATLACWSSLWLALRERDTPGQIVIQDSTIRYLRPVTQDFSSRSGPIEPAALEKLVAAVNKRGRGRIALSSEVFDPEGVAVNFSGRYVVETPAASAR
jgi:thioesterase domain-containing protein